MVTKVRFLDPHFQALNSSGASVPGAQLFFYAQGTTTLNDTYQDEALTLLNTNPVIADGSGRFPVIYGKSQVYTVKMTDEDGVTLDTSDWDATEPVSPTSATTTAEGIVELATTAEVDTGTDSTRAVTSDGVEETRKRLRGSREETGTSFTLLASDAGQVIYTTSNSAVTITVNSAVMSADDIVFVRQWGTGQVTVAAGTATVHGPNGKKTQAQYSKLSIEFKDATTAVVDGDVVV